MKSFFAADANFAQVAELVGVVGLDNVVDAAGVAVVLKKKLVKSLQTIHNGGNDSYIRQSEL